MAQVIVRILMGVELVFSICSLSRISKYPIKKNATGKIARPHKVLILKFNETNKTIASMNPGMNQRQILSMAKACCVGSCVDGFILDLESSGNHADTIKTGKANGWCDHDLS